MNTEIRRMRAAEIPSVKAVETACGLSPWSEADYLAELVRPDALALTAYADRELAGFILARLITNHHRALQIPKPMQEMEIFNIGVSPLFRRRGIAASLIKSAVACLDPETDHAIFLEVREKNAEAISFYETVGFERIGIRKNFYTAPADNALLMARTSG